MHPRIFIKPMVLSAVVVVFMSTCGGSVNPLIWKSQCERRISPQSLIQPEKMGDFSEEMKEKTPQEIFEYIESEISYVSDFLNYGSLEHLPTAEEVLLTRKDDCDGQAVLLCSVLRYQGYPAYTVVGPSHAWVEIATDDTLFINYRGGPWVVRFNEAAVQWNFPSLFLLILEEFMILTVFFSLAWYAYERRVLIYVREALGYLKYVFLFVSGYFLIGVFIMMAKSTLWVVWLVIFVVSFLVIMKLSERLNLPK